MYVPGEEQHDNETLRLEDPSVLQDVRTTVMKLPTGQEVTMHASWRDPLHARKRTQQQALGFDSCGIFYISGNVQVTLNFDLSALCLLTAECTDPIESHEHFHVFEGENHPGQHWGCYREKKEKEKDSEKDLRARLTDLLTPSTTPEALNAIPKRDPMHIMLPCVPGVPCLTKGTV